MFSVSLRKSSNADPSLSHFESAFVIISSYYENQGDMRKLQVQGQIILENQSSEVILIPTVKVLFGIEEDETYEKGFLAPHEFAT